MFIKIAPAILVAASLLTGAHATLECSIQTFKANVKHISVHSAQDLKTPITRDHTNGGWASVTVTDKLAQPLYKAERRIDFRHTGSDCRDPVGDYSAYPCNGDYVVHAGDNTCAEVKHSEKPGSQSSASVVFAPGKADEEVLFRAHLNRLTNNWKIRVPDTCAHERFEASAEGMKVITFSANVAHKWSKVVVELDSVDYNFGKGWLCGHDSALNSDRPLFKTTDGQVWTITNVSFDKKTDAQTLN